MLVPMKPTRKLMDWQDEALIKRAWGLLSLLATQAAAMIAALPADRRGARAVHRILRIGEAMARRILMMTALDAGLAALPAIPSTPLSAKARAALKALTKDKNHIPALRFKLAEPLSTRVSTDAPGARYTSMDKGPRIRLLWDDDPFCVTRALLAPPPPSPPDPEPAPEPDRLSQRLDILNDVIAHPIRHTRRMSRWLARQAVQRHGRSTPLRPGRPPGQIKTRRLRGPEQACLGDLDWAARRLKTRTAATGPPVPAFIIPD